MRITNSWAIAKVVMATSLFLPFLHFTTEAALGDAASRMDVMKAREHINKGNLYMGRLAFQQAIDEYLEALIVDPSNQAAKDNIVLAHNNWGIVHFRQKKYDEARAEWEAALKLNPLDRNAKANLVVLKQTMARLGIQGGNGDGAAKEGEAGKKEKFPATKEVKDPPPSSSAVMILTPGIKQSSSTTSSTDAGAVKSYADNTPSDARPVSTGTSGTTTSGPSTNSGATSAASATTPPPAVTPTATYNENNTGGGVSISTLEDKLAGIELKIYGHKQADAPVLKRLEKIEMDTAGSVKTGNIKDRIEALRQSYGL